MHAEHNIRSVLVLQPRGGDSAALAEFFRQHDILGIAVRDGGAWSAEFHVPVSGSGPVMVTALWDSPAAYQRWQTHPMRDELGPGLGQLIDETPNLAVANGIYEIVISATHPSIPSPQGEHVNA
jgi:hypothetical protein